MKDTLLTLTLKKLIQPFASLKLTVVLIAMAMLLIYAGTWAQIDMSIWQVQKKFFHSFFCWIDFQTFLQRPADGRRIPGGFPMLGGYTVGLLLLINLLSAHLTRFKLTWRDVILIPALALMIVPLVVWQYQGTDWLFNFVRKFGLDLASFTSIPFFVWVVLTSALLGLPLYFALFTLHAKRGGVIMIHLGLVLLLVGEGITSGMQTERSMTIDEGSYANFVSDTQRAELAIVDPSNKDYDDHVVIPGSLLAQRGDIRDSRLPFDVKVEDYFVNSDIGSGDEVRIRATHGTGTRVPIVGRQRTTGVDAQNIDFPSAYVTLSKNGQPLGTYLFTVIDLDPQSPPINRPQPVEVDGKKYLVQLRFAREYKPYTVHLLDFVHDRYTGTDIPKDFASRVRLVDPSRSEERDVRIWMNHPLRYNGETFFQSSFKPGDKTTVLQIVKNPGLVLPYAACTITAVGLVIHLGLALANFLRKRPRPVIDEDSRITAADVLFPAAVVLGCVLLLMYVATPRQRSTEKVDLASFGALPVSFDGRIVPFDSVARNSLKVLAGKESFYDGKEAVPPLRFLLELFTDSKAARDYKLFRIDHPDLKSLLGLSEEKRYFSLAEIMPGGAKYDEQYNIARKLPKTQRSAYHEAILDLGSRLSVFLRLTRIEQLYAAAPAASTEDWKPLGEATTANPSAEAFVRIVTAYQQQDRESFSRAVADYRSAVDKIQPTQTAKASFESWYNGAAPLFVCCILYVVVFLLAACSWLVWARPLSRAAFAMLVLTFTVHTLAIIARIYLSGRAPVTNLESSAIFIGWVGVALGIALELILRQGIGSVVSAVLGFLSLCIYINIAKGDTMKVLQAVLDTNFWLWTHVPAITIGYGATFFAWGSGVAFVIIGLFTKWLDGPWGKNLSRAIYGITCFAIIFSFVGTILGGIWADQSWGRFWGWDPKENGAVLIVLANALLLHSRWAGLARERGIACLAIFGGIVTSWSWFGTNLLGVGLHSYGFMDGAMMALFAFVLFNLLMIVLAYVLPWRSALAAPRPESKRSVVPVIIPEPT